MHVILISDQHCTVVNESTGTDQYVYHYNDYVGGSVEAYEDAEKLCIMLNGKDK